MKKAPLHFESCHKSSDIVTKTHSYVVTKRGKLVDNDADEEERAGNLYK